MADSSSKPQIIKSEYNLRSRKTKTNLEQSSSSLNESTANITAEVESRSSLTEFSCIICYEILIEPIKLKCDHELCIKCFKSLIKNKNFSCPMCRKVIPKSNRENIEMLIDAKKWEYIKQKFPSDVDKRMKEETKLKENEANERQLFLKKQRLIQQEEEERNVDRPPIRQIVS